MPKNRISFKQFTALEDPIAVTDNQIGILIIFNGELLCKNALDKKTLTHLAPYSGVIFNAASIPEIVIEDASLNGIIFWLDIIFFQNVLALIQFETSLHPAQPLNHVLLPPENETELLIHSFELYAKKNNCMSVVYESKLLELIWLISRYDKIALEQFMYPYMIPDRIFLDSIINKYYRQNLSVDQLASLAGYSISTFKRKFVAAYKCSPHKWIQNMRLNEAEGLIKFTDKTISEVGFEVGFENISHFIQAFRQKFGITPKLLKSRCSNQRMAS